MTVLRQLYDQNGQVLEGQGASKDEILRRGLLHGAAHVWLWRLKDDEVEVLLQKRARAKRTWPNLLDISAAGHIDQGETPLQAAVRETEEELGLTLNTAQLIVGGWLHRQLIAPSGDIENEICYYYTVHVSQTLDFSLEEREVEALVWKKLAQVRAELANPALQNYYVFQGEKYYREVFNFIDDQARLAS